ncbi:hypothetical protein ABT063_44785 [Streptomyces sp. NPDC002838]|uniref:hypothetical protein n=1 Tax=Streptomyces sp. NPDC002838 TaxID=3154436 RepID=UPI00332484DE
MTAEHEGHAGGHAGPDALMAAITDEPLTDEARADAAFMAEHRSATADVALLREQLGIIGRTLGEPPKAPEPVPVRPYRSRRRALNLAFGTLAVAAAAAVVAGMGWLLAQAGGGIGATSDSGDSAASKQEAGTRFGSPRYLACARTVVEGTVTGVERLPGTDTLRVAVHVTRHYKPAKGEEELVFVIDRYDVTRVEQGDPVLLGIPQDAAVPDHWVVGAENVARERAWITGSLAESRELTCE